MVSPLGPLFANMYMTPGHLEENIMKNLKDKVILYCRYVDDIFMLTKDNEQAENIKVQVAKHSVLKFTI